MKRLTANSANQLEKLVNEQVNTVVLLFTGTKQANGKSWCPDCVVADPVIESVTQQLKTADLTFITVPVGDLPTWKSPDNQYRKHPVYSVDCVPTLINVTKSQRLEEGGCADEKLVKQLFEGTLGNSTTSKAGTCEDGVCRIR